jgi:hypothetical protein
MIVPTILLSSMLVAAAAAASSPADGTYNYAVTVNGARLGSASITVGHASSAVRLDEKSSATYNGMPASGTATMVLDMDLAPTAYQASYSAAGQSGRSNVSFSGSSASVSGPSGNNTFTLIGGAKRFAVLDGTMLAGMFILPAQMRAWSGAQATILAPMYGQSLPLALDATAKPNRPSGLPSGDVNLSVSGQVPFTVWYDATTLLVDEVDVPSQGVAVTRVR